MQQQQLLMVAAAQAPPRAAEIFQWTAAQLATAWTYVQTGILPAGARRQVRGQWPNPALVPIPGCPGCIALDPAIMNVGQSGISVNAKHYGTFSKAPWVRNQNRVQSLTILACLADPNWTGGAPDRATALAMAASSAFDFSHICLVNCCVNTNHIVLESSALNQARGNSCCARLSMMDALLIAQGIQGLTPAQQQTVAGHYSAWDVCRHGPPRCITTRETLQARDVWYTNY